VGAQRVVVFACGESLRGDDAAAHVAVAALPLAGRAYAEIRRIGQLEPEDLISLPSGTPVIVVDTVTGVEPGRLVEFDLSDIGACAAAVRPRSTHQLPLDQVVGMADVLGHPVTGAFLGVGGDSFEPGEPLSDHVQKALPALRAAIAEEVQQLGSRRPAGGAVPSLVRQSAATRCVIGPERRLS
jgi:hydrogenase maturation protease